MYTFLQFVIDKNLFLTGIFDESDEDQINFSKKDFFATPLHIIQKRIIDKFSEKVDLSHLKIPENCYTLAELMYNDSALNIRKTTLDLLVNDADQPYIILSCYEINTNYFDILKDSFRESVYEFKNDLRNKLIFGITEKFKCKTFPDYKKSLILHISGFKTLKNLTNNITLKDAETIYTIY